MKKLTRLISVAMVAFLIVLLFSPGRVDAQQAKRITGYRPSPVKVGG